MRPLQVFQSPFRQHRLCQQHLHPIGDFLLRQPQLDVEIPGIHIQCPHHAHRRLQDGFVQDLNVCSQAPGVEIVHLAYLAAVFLAHRIPRHHQTLMDPEGRQSCHQAADRVAVLVAARNVRQHEHVFLTCGQGRQHARIRPGSSDGVVRYRDHIRSGVFQALDSRQPRQDIIRGRGIGFHKYRFALSFKQRHEGVVRTALHKAGILLRFRQIILLPVRLVQRPRQGLNVLRCGATAATHRNAPGIKRGKDLSKVVRLSREGHPVAGHRRAPCIGPHHQRPVPMQRLHEFHHPGRSLKTVEAQAIHQRRGFLKQGLHFQTRPGEPICFHREADNDLRPRNRLADPVNRRTKRSQLGLCLEQEPVYTARRKGIHQ